MPSTLGPLTESQEIVSKRIELKPRQGSILEKQRIYKDLLVEALAYLLDIPGGLEEDDLDKLITKIKDSINA